MKIADYFAEGEEPPVLALLLNAIQDKDVLADDAADVIEQPAEYVTDDRGHIVRKSKALVRRASGEEIKAFRQQAGDAMTALHRYALYCWLTPDHKGFVALMQSVEAGSALVARYEPQFHLHYRSHLTAIGRVAARNDHQEEDAAAFLYFMQGVLMASREEWLRAAGHA